MRSTSPEADNQSPRTPVVWVLVDDRPGHRTQVVGLAESLGWGYEVKDLHFNPLNRISNRLLGASLLGLDHARSSALAPPWPNLVIAMGRRAAPVARWIGRQGGGTTRLVQLGRKGADDADAFDLSVTCAHFRLPPHPRRLITTVPITQVTENRLKAEAERWRGLFDGPHPHIAVLVGGPTAQHRLDEAVARQLAHDVRAFAEDCGGSLHIVTSRRTGRGVTDALRDVAGPSAHVHEWTRDAEANAYLGYLALADVLIVTGESESMLAEAAAAGKTLYVYPIPEKPDALKRRVAERVLRRAQGRGVGAAVCRSLVAGGLFRPPRRLEEMHAALYRARAANRFGTSLADAVRSPLPDSEAIVARVRAVIAAGDAPRTEAPQPGGLWALLGYVSRSDSRTFWFQSDDARAFEGLAPLLAMLRHRYPRVEPLFVTARRDDFVRLTAGHPEIKVFMAPVPAANAARRMLKRVNARLVLLLGDPSAKQQPVIRAAADRHIPVVRVGQGSEAEPGIEACIATESAPETLLDTIAPLMQRDLKQRRSEHNRMLDPKRLATALVRSGPGEWVARRRHRRIACIEELRAALGDPTTILCLGNGPSSEDPQLLDLQYDCLFRVNDRWLGRGTLDRPDMVFTGDRATVAKVRGAIFGFQSDAAADRLKLQRALGLLDPPLRFVSVDSLGTFLDTMGLRAAPTNGATMLATAVALAPQRLIIGGIDLFLDPRGSYPGDPNTANAYTPRHDRDEEVRIIKRALEVYEGDVTIVSEVLTRTLALEMDLDEGREYAAER